MRTVAVQLGLIFLLAASANAWQNEHLCVARAQNNTCTLCAYATASGPDCISLKTVIPGCYIYNSDGSCYYCQDGYYQNINATNNNICTPLSNAVSKFCTVSYINPDTCSICKNGVIALDGVCQDDIPCFDPNCDQCYIDPITRLSGCWYCKPNHFLFSISNSPVCVPSTPAFEGCWSSSSLYHCDFCNVGYSAKNGRCYKSDDTKFKSAERVAVWGAVVAMAMAWLRV